MAATLASAMTLPQFGKIVDRYSPMAVTLLIVPGLALACVLMAASHSIVMLVVTIYMLRLFGQGMMTHNAMTATARWFVAQRGKAVSVVTQGVNAGSAIFPITFVVVSTAIGWRQSWVVAGVLLLVVALPLIVSFIRVDRTPRASDPQPRFQPGRDWTRHEVVRDPLFYLLLMGVMAPPFIGTSIFFHQIHLVELRGWSLEVFGSSFALMSTLTVIFALVSGHLIDRFSAVALLPGFLLPLGVACLVLGFFTGQWSVFAFMTLLGISSGFSWTLFGALWVEVYGSRHLGSVRALIESAMVLASAIGPGLTGVLIDTGVALPAQIVAMGLYCLVVSFAMPGASRRISLRLATDRK
jgi:MFS family permease